MPNRVVNYTFRVQDHHTIALVVVDVDDGNMPTVQLGQMHRVGDVVGENLPPS